MKKFKAPRSFPSSRKGKFVPKPSPGPHPINESIPLLMFLRDALSYVRTAREARKVINEGLVKVDGKVRKDPRWPLGLFDSVEIQKVNEIYRLLPAKEGFKLLPISRKEATSKLFKICGITTLKGGKLQLNLTDGVNRLVRKKYNCGDSLLLQVPTFKILDSVKLVNGSLVSIIKGKHRGKLGRFKKLKTVRSSAENRAFIELESTIKNFPLSAVFAVGRKKPLIKFE